MIWKQSRGFSLAELVLAIGLLTIISITVAGVFIHLLHSSAKTTDLTAARTLARRILDRALRAGPPSWGYAALTGSQSMVTQASESQAEFNYVISPQPLKVPDTGMAGVSREIYYVEVEVTWWGTDPNAARAGMGRLSTKISQVASFQR